MKNGLNGYLTDIIKKYQVLGYGQKTYNRTNALLVIYIRGNTK